VICTGGGVCAGVAGMVESAAGEPLDSRPVILASETLTTGKSEVSAMRWWIGLRSVYR